MNEELPPPFDPANQPPEIPSSIPPGAPKPPNFWGLFGLGLGLVLLSWLLCAAFGSPTPFGIAFLVAFVFLFIPGYRGIFIGFASAIGVALLLAAIACGVLGSGSMR